MQFSGSIICISELFSGSPFRFRMSESEAHGGAARQPKVIVVDDERLLADTTTAILRREGFLAKTAYDGFDALEMAATFEPDYLLTDIMMPGMNGVELAIAMSRMYSKTKILLVSGQAGISDILEDCKAKGFEFPLLAKPVHPARLVEGLKSLKRD